MELAVKSVRDNVAPARRGAHDLRLDVLDVICRTTYAERAAY